MMSKFLHGKVFLIVFLSFSFCLSAQSNSKNNAKQNPVKIYNQAVDHLENEDYYAASQCFLEVVNLNPAYSDAWFNLALCSYQLGEFDLAYHYLESAEKYEKNNSTV